MPQPEIILRALFDAAVDAAAPAGCLPPHLPPPPAGRTVVIGAGKAAASMAAAVEAHWPADAALSGLVVTRYGHGAGTRRITVVEAAHPVPDAAGQQAAERILELATGLGPDDLLLCLISGGGSSLLALPAAGLTLEDKRAVNKALLRSGANIGEMNTVRRHLSAIKGGRLAAAAWPARCLTLAISDVPGDDPAVIASGPTVPDPTSFADARAVLAKYGIDPPPAVAAHLAAAVEETPKPGDPRLSAASFRMIATPARSLEAAAESARGFGLTPILLGDDLEGEARELGAAHAALAAGHAPGTVLISGGETTVTVRGNGKGGRNVEYLLGFGLAAEAATGPRTLAAVACDTDGIDGTEDAAGAVLLPGDLAKARASGNDPTSHLLNNDAYTLFHTLNRLIVTGPTRTNVNDFRAILVM